MCFENLQFNSTTDPRPIRDWKIVAQKEEASLFETSQMLATFLSSTPLLSNAWRQCDAANRALPGRFVVNCIDGVAYVAFSGIQAVGAGFEFFKTPNSSGDGLFSSLVDHEGEPALFQPGFLHLFSSLYSTPEFQSQILATVNSNKAVIFTGHSIGGTIASLTTLWLLSSFPSLSSTCSLLCITFGSPLLGNEALSRVILREKWGSKFCHVVSQHDIVPRLLFSPLRSISAQLSHLLEFWHFLMRFPQQFQKPMIGLSEKEISELCLFVSDHVSAAATAEEQEDTVVCKSSYRPFGSYLFCSREGAVCIDNPTAVIRLLHLTFKRGSVNSSIEEHLLYGDCVPRISDQFLKRRSSASRVQNSSYEAGISLALEALGMQTQDPTAGKTGTCLMMARQLGCKPTLNSAELAVRLSKVTPCRAQIEWYKNACDDYLGYYDSFKLKRASKREFQVNINRKKLGLFWDNVIDMMQTNHLPHDFHKRAKWVNASQFYKLLVEPLEIAEYYRTGKHRTQGHYLVRGRERRFYIFDKWWQDADANVHKQCNNKVKRSHFAGLTQDTCFWARVEEAKEWATESRRERNIGNLVVLWENLNKFDCYARELIERKEVSKDVLAEDSSYVLWVEEWKDLKSELAIRIPTQQPGHLEEMVSDLSNDTNHSLLM